MQIDRYIWIIISFFFFFFPEANIRRPFKYLNTIEIQYINLLPNSVSPFTHYGYQHSLCITMALMAQWKLKLDLNNITPNGKSHIETSCRSCGLTVPASVHDQCSGNLPSRADLVHSCGSRDEVSKRRIYQVFSPQMKAQKNIVYHRFVQLH